MPLTWTAPGALWLLALIALVWAAHARSRTTFTRPHRILQAVVRSLLLAALVLAIARPVVSRHASRLSVVYAVDVSHSVASAAIQEAADRIDEMTRQLEPDHMRLIAFGRTAAPLADTGALRRMASAPAAGTGDPIDRSGTDLEGALQAARALLAPGHLPRVVLMADGRITAGHTPAGAARLARERIPVFVEPLRPRAIAGDAWIESIALPDRVPAGALQEIVVTAGSHADAEGTLEVRSGDTVLARSLVALRRGTTRVPLDAVFDRAGAHAVVAALRVGGDPLPANDALATSTWAAARTPVLYIEGKPESARYLTAALTGSGFDVTVGDPAALPASIEGLEPFDLVILSDVERRAIGAPAMQSLARWVEERGGGLLIAGGDAVYGEGGEVAGYRGSPLERLAPVTFERRDEPQVALVIVLDRSWSMAGASMELTKTAAQAAVDVLSDAQSIGILTFNDKFAWDVPLRPVAGNREEIREKIAAIGPGGHTLIYPAVEQAYLALRDADARAKHVILLSDGRSYPGEYEALLRKMAAARITVSTVAVGPSADPDLLRNLATWGGGRAYVVADAAQVPEIFVKEAKTAATPSFDEKAITPIVRTPAFLAGVDLSRLPPLGGRTATVLKDGALELLSTSEKDPLLAFWQTGLGRTAVFASDVKDRWAARWVTWPGYAPFFSSVARALQRQRPAPLALSLAAGPPRGGIRHVTAVVEAREPDGRYRNLLTPSVEVRAPGRAPVSLPARQVAPGRYEAAIVTTADVPWTFTVPDNDPASAPTTRSLVPDDAAEYRFAPVDEDALRAIASATGGEWQPSAAALASRAGDRRTERRALWPLLLVLALVLWPVDIYLRRIRLFEPAAAAPLPSASAVPTAGR